MSPSVDYSAAAEPVVEHIRNARAVLDLFSTVTLPALRDSTTDIELWAEVSAVIAVVRLRLVRAEAAVPPPVPASAYWGLAQLELELAAAGQLTTLRRAFLADIDRGLPRP